MSVLALRRFPVRILLAVLLAAGTLPFAACAKKAQVDTAKMEQLPPPPPTPKPRPTDDGKAPGGFDPLGGLLGSGGPPPGSPTEQALLQKYRTALVGTWTADLGNGTTEELTYNADGTFVAKLTGPTPASEAGKYTVQGLVGTRGLKVQLTTGMSAKTVRAIFEDNELHHPTLQPGVTGTFRKK